MRVIFDLYFRSDVYCVDNEFKHFIIEKDVEDTASLRELAISVIKESETNEYANLSTNSPIPITIKSNSTEQNFTIKYRLNNNGTIRLLNLIESFHVDILFSELKELVNEGYINGDYAYIIVGPQPQLGASGGFGIIDFSDLIGNFLGLWGITVTPISFFTKKVLLPIRDRKWRKIVARWKNENQIEFPWEIREFFDCKGNWKTNEVKKRLKISEQEVGQLMRALGYDLVGNEWKLGQSRKSNSKRNKWLSNEEKFYSKKLKI